MIENAAMIPCDDSGWSGQYRKMGMGEDLDDWRHQETATASELADGSLRQASLDVPGLTILCHPSPERVGEQAALIGLRRDGEVSVSRLEPDFRALDDEHRRPLADHRLSRQSFHLEQRPGGRLILDASACPTPLSIGGEAIDGIRQIAAEQLVEGVVLLLASRVVLLLHTLRPSVSRPPAYGLVGESSAMLRLRREIERVADLDYPVLLRGESGTGKELVARAIQGASPRRDRPYCAVNVAAIPATLAAAELFGAAKGAFSGADRRRPGYFQRAHGGTLFLDEIGEMSPEVQALLLRTLESRDIQPVGDDQPQRVDVRVIAATDADLEQAIADGRFKEPLLHRLASYEIELPPLRQRRDDIGRLFFFFLRQELAELGESDRLADAGRRRPWVSAKLVARLAAFDWPGNVRQLRNVVRQLAVASRGSETMEVGSRIESLLAKQSGSSPTENPQAESALGEIPPTGRQTRAAAKTYRDPSEVDHDELLAALRAHQFRLQPTAVALGVSRASLYALIEACPLVRKASDLGREEIEAVGATCDGRHEAMAERLEVSKQGLKMRLKELGLT